MTDISMIEAARQRIGSEAVRTPLLSSPFLDEIAGRKILVKAECLQRTGSFKFRGGWSAVSGIAPDVRQRGVIAFSSGNHAQGVALAAALHGVPAVIIMPLDAPKIKIDNTKAYGAEVVLFDRSKDDRDAIGAKLSQERGLTLIKPFDEPLVIAGQGTVGLEIAEQGHELGIDKAEVLVPCGGGGLTSGIALALEAKATNYTVRTCEPEKFDDVARSLASGKIERNDALSGSVCDAIITPQPGNITFPIMASHCGTGIAVTEDEALRAMVLAFLRLKVVVEPGGAVALAAALFHGAELQTETVIAVASGGNVDPDVMASALSRFAN
ncbi:threonine ammonia-lyase [Agrobacterium rosae]|uniref:Threonine/serine dehydratase n=1 Tax=Agrobacterium rosae TaxID=1972867 RepID=A0AAW9FI84_9HYPH|nr:threonine/serine dehydratase [Agrobacterium rosae]MDX8304163.1 threonine/serine dehydratase [Agrobacterium rosae]POO54640.1 threonine ammonia-lyase [Agrobacterium rosae]